MRRRRFRAIWSPACLLASMSIVLTSGCIQIRPIPMDARIGTMLELERLPLRVAVVVPDPPTHRVMYTPPAMTGRRDPIDQTEQMSESVWPLGGELARASRKVFSQLFADVASLRQLPPPGEYDAVIQPRIDVVRIIGFMDSSMLSVRAWQNLSFDWGITVLDHAGVQMLGQTGTTSEKRIDVEASFSTKGYVNTLGAGSSELLASMVKEWGTMIALSPEIRAYAHRSRN